VHGVRADASDVSIAGSTVTAQGEERATEVVSVYSTNGSIVVDTSSIEARSFEGASTAVRIQGCGGGEAHVTDNASIRATGVEGTTTAVRVTGDCDTWISENTIVSVGDDNSTNYAVSCASGALCRVLDNPDIHTERAAVGTPSTVLGVGIFCDSSGCAEIRRNVVKGLAPGTCARICRSEARGVVLSNSSAVLSDNEVFGGCADESTGI
jgi:hypothetical protein